MPLKNPSISFAVTVARGRAMPRPKYWLTQVRGQLGQNGPNPAIVNHQFP
jgi:hypothetical protein